MDEKLKIFVTEKLAGNPYGNAAPGTVTAAGAQGIEVATGNGVIVIKELQGPSAKRMTAGAYLNGHPVKEGTVLGQ